MDLIKYPTKITLYNPGNGGMIIKTQNIINVNIITWIIHHIIMF